MKSLRDRSKSQSVAPFYEEALLDFLAQGRSERQWAYHWLNKMPDLIAYAHQQWEARDLQGIGATLGSIDVLVSRPNCLGQLALVRSHLLDLARNDGWKYGTSLLDGFLKTLHRISAILTTATIKTEPLRPHRTRLL